MCYNVYIVNFFKELKMIQILLGLIVSFACFDNLEMEQAIEKGEIVSAVVHSEEEMNDVVEKMAAKNYSCEFIVYKYNERELLEMMLGFWPNSVNDSKEKIQHYIEKSYGVNLEYINNNKENAVFIIRYKP